MLVCGSCSKALARLIVELTATSHHLNPGTALRTKTPGRKSGFGLTFLRRLSRLLGLGFGGCCSARSCTQGLNWVVYGVWALTLVAAIFQFALGQVGAAFISAIVKRDSSAVVVVFAIGVTVVFVNVTLATAAAFLGERVTNHHQQHHSDWLTDLADWLSHTGATVLPPAARHASCGAKSWSRWRMKSTLTARSRTG